MDCPCVHYWTICTSRCTERCRCFRAIECGIENVSNQKMLPQGSCTCLRLNVTNSVCFCLHWLPLCASFWCTFLTFYETMNLKMAFLLHCVCDPLLAVSNCTGTHAFIRSNVELWGRRWNVLRGVLVGNKHAIILLPTILPSQEYTGNTRNCLWMHRIADVKTGGNDINDSCGTYTHPPRRTMWKRL